MQIVIDIPEEFEKDYATDRFEDCMTRVLMDCKELGYQGLTGKYEHETICMLIDSFDNSIVIHGHGDLKDIGQCNRKLFYQQCGGADSLITAKTAFDMLLALPTIIPANKEKE